MQILVDYDNILEPHRRLGLGLLTERIVERLLVGAVQVGQEVHLRLYGGWYEGPTLSKRAQTLAAEIRREFPRIVRPSIGPQLKATCELALSLDIDPSTHFHHTLRRQSPPLDVRCNDPKFFGCPHATCPIIGVHETFRLGRCPESTCNRTLQDLLYRSSQKLVDTMLTADLIHVAGRLPEAVAVLSSDDDLWPGLHSVLSAGHVAVQIHTRPDGIARHPYAIVGRVGYIAVELT